MIIGEDFTIMDHEEKEKTLPIKLLLSPYENVIFRYNTVSIREDADEGTAKIVFSYDIIEMGDHIETTLRKDERFNDVLGLILNRMILETVESGDLNDRKNDFEESAAK